MNGYALTAAIIQAIASLAWPAAVFGAVWLFREKLIRLLPLLQVKHKDWEASFRLDQAEREAAELPPPPAVPEAKPTPEEKSKFELIAQISPRAAILEVRTDIEEALLFLAKAAKVPSPGRHIAGLTRLLRTQEIIDPQTSALLDDLRVLGNQAAHGAGDFSKDDALRYRALADNVIARLQETAGKMAA
jgi:hypothetical protein